MKLKSYTSLGTVLRQSLNLLYPPSITGYDWLNEYFAGGKSHHVMSTRGNGMTDWYIDGKKVK